MVIERGMEWIVQHEFLGTEFDFVASDSSGFVAYFSSAGFGPIPKQAALFGEQMYDLCERIEELAKISQAEELSIEPNLGAWVAAAERGFYAYDWSHKKAHYELVARPIVALRVSELKAQTGLWEFIGTCQFQYEFRSAKIIEA